MIKGIVEGLKTYRKSFKLIGTLGLWKYFAIPMLISLLTATAIGFSAWGFSDNLGHWIAQIWPWEWGAEGFYRIAQFLSALVIIAIGLILYKHIVMALSAPFMSPVSEKIELHFKGTNSVYRETTFMQQLMRGIRINVRNLLLELLITLPVLLLNLIPVIGSIIATVILFLTQSYYAGFGNMDYTLERHFGYGDSVDPISVTAATVQTIDLLDKKNKLSQRELPQKETVPKELPQS